MLPPPFALHRTEDRGSAELATEVDHLEDELEGRLALGRIGVGEGKAVFYHACSGSDGGDAEVVFCREGFDFSDGDEVGAGEEKFDGVVAVFFSGGESFGDGLLKDEGAGGCFGDLGESDG